MAAIVLSPSNKNRFHDFIKGKNIKARLLATVPVYIYLRKGHPLLSEGTKGNAFPYEKLKEYTFIDYPQGGVRDLMLQEIFPVLPKNDTKVVEMPSYYIRDEIIAQSDAYGVGADRGEGRMEALEKVPVPNTAMEVYCCYSTSKPCPLADEYIEIVLKKLADII